MPVAPQAEILASTTESVELSAVGSSIVLATKLSLRDRAGGIRAIVRDLAPDQRIYLVFRNPSADVTPGTLYGVYIDLPADAGTKERSLHRVGYLNFFAFTQATASGSSRERQRSLDITAVVKGLAVRNRLSSNTTVTIMPTHHPSANFAPKISKIELVRQ